MTLDQRRRGGYDSDMVSITGVAPSLWEERGISGVYCTLAL
jgi:hypothetical protein